jgi:hypothetical protein
LVIAFFTVANSVTILRHWEIAISEFHAAVGETNLRRISVYSNSLFLITDKSLMIYFQREAELAAAIVNSTVILR